MDRNVACWTKAERISVSTMPTCPHFHRHRHHHRHHHRRQLINDDPRESSRWHLLSIDEQASMVSGLEYGVAGGGGGGGGAADGSGEGDEEESWLQFLFKSQINRPPGSRAKASHV